MKINVIAILCISLLTAGIAAKDNKIEHHEGVQLKRMSSFQVPQKDLSLFFGGKLKDDLFIQNRCYTLRSDYNDQQDFFRHKLELDAAVAQGVERHGKPASQAAVRLSNYVLWQKESQYTPLYIDQITLPEAGDVTVAKNIPVKTLVPLLFVEEAWFQIHFDTFVKTLKENPTSLKVGYFSYQLGRGISMGIHKDLGVECLGGAGEGDFTRYPVMPPGILLRHAFTPQFSVDAYFNLWKETNTSLSDTLKPTRAQRLEGPQPERGPGRDAWSVSMRGDYTTQSDSVGKLLVQPYVLYTKAPEQTIEIFADASSKLLTVGGMLDWQKNNLTINVEVALQAGSQRVHALDRNQMELSSGADGSIGRSFTHIQAVAKNEPALPANPTTASTAPAGDNTGSMFPNNLFEPNNNPLQLVNNETNRTLDKQGDFLRISNGGFLAIQPGSGARLFNGNIFGNKRFRPAYRLDNRGLMVMADAIYALEEFPIKLAAAGGYISGDSYPYNDETTRISNSFIPQRSRYQGYGVKSFLFFDRMIIPRPLNISHRTLYAQNHLKDLSNLQFLGIGATWFPFKKESKGHCGIDIMVLGETASIKQWDKNGTHPDPAIETQLVRLRNSLTPGAADKNPTLFSGWESTKRASKFLGVEVDTRFHYQLLEHCDATARVSVFVPGQLYKDLDGQPNSLTRRTDKEGFLRYDSLGSSTALACTIGLNYRF
jgi:hypothetical protein